MYDDYIVPVYTILDDILRIMNYHDDPRATISATEILTVAVDRIQDRVLSGMGLLVLHSGHESKVFKRLMGTTCDLKWRDIGEKERLWVVEPGHPIVEGLRDYIEVPHAEMYGEPFYIPTPEQVIFTL